MRLINGRELKGGGEEGCGGEVGRNDDASANASRGRRRLSPLVLLPLVALALTATVRFVSPDLWRGGDVPPAHDMDRVWGEVIDDVDGGESSSSSSVLHLPSVRRALGEGAFDDLNDILRGTVIALPDALNVQADLPWPLTSVFIDVRNLRCTDLSLDDVRLRYRQVDARKYEWTVGVSGLAVRCNLDWWYRYDGGFLLGWVRGSGSADMRSEGSSILATMTFEDVNDLLGDAAVPSWDSTVTGCDAHFAITDISFRGGISGAILNVFRNAVKRTAYAEINEKACEEVGDVDGLVDDVLRRFSDIIERYVSFGGGDGLTNEPTEDEGNGGSGQEELVNFTSASGLDTLLSLVDGIVGGGGGGGTDGISDHRDDEMHNRVGINSILRSTILEDDGSLALRLSDLQLPDGGDNEVGVLYEGHDMLTETTLELTAVRVFGLDTFTSFDPFNVVGPRTLRNHAHLSRLEVEADLEVVMRPSTHSSSVIVSGGGSGSSAASSRGGPVVERITVRMGIADVNATISLRADVGRDAIGDVMLGSILHLDQMGPCLAHTVNSIQFTQLTVEVGDFVSPPTVSGFIDHGLDRILNDAAHAAFVMLEPALLRAMPGLFRTTVLRVVNDVIGDLLLGQSDIECPRPPTTSITEAVGRYVDLRELLTTTTGTTSGDGDGDGRRTAGDVSNEASNSSSPSSVERPFYGDVISTFMDMVNDRFLSQDPQTGLARINRALIEGATVSQSNVSGTVVLNDGDDLLSLSLTTQGVEGDITNGGEGNITNGGRRGLQIRVHDARLENVDTVGYPAVLLSPPSDQPHTVTNRVTLGDDYDDGRALRASVRLSVAAGDGGGSSKLRSNEMDLYVEVGGMEIAAVLVALVDAAALLEFPLRDVLNPNCWIATIPSPESLDDVVTAALVDVELSAESIRLGVSCVDNCTSVGLTEELPVVLDMIGSIGIPSLLGAVVMNGTMDWLTGDDLRSRVDGTIIEAGGRCPHDPNFDPTFSSMQHSPPPRNTFANMTPPLEFVEVALFSLSLAAQAAAVVVSVDQVGVDMDENSVDPLTGQDSLVVPEGIRLIDFVDLYTNSQLFRLGLDILHDNLGEQRATGGAGDDGDDVERHDVVGVNAILRSTMLDEDGAYEIPLVGAASLAYQQNGVHIRLSTVRILGLDTFNRFDVFDIIAPQTARSSVSLDSFEVEFGLDVTVEGSRGGSSSRRTANDKVQTITVRLGVQDVNATVSLLLAIDHDKLGDIQLGSILDTGNIIKCFVSSAIKVELTQLSVNVGSVQTPAVTGFSSSDVLEGALDAATKLIFDKYEDVIVEAVGGLFGVTIRGFLNDILHDYVTDRSLKGCPSPPIAMDATYLDLREVFSRKEYSRENGNDLNHKYGDLFMILTGLLDKVLLSPDPSTGVARVNDLLIEPLTKNQSGIPGMVKFKDDLLHQNSKISIPGFQGGIQFRAYNASIDNLNSIGAPLALLQPDELDAQTVVNRATAGAYSKPVQTKARVMFSLEGNDMRIHNDVDLSVEIELAEILAEFMATVDEKSFLTFPLRDVLNPYCWLATIPAPTMSEFGVRLSSSVVTVALSKLEAVAARVDFALKCHSCSSPGLQEMTGQPEIDATDIANRILNMTTSLLEGDFLQVKVDRMLALSHGMCPHSPSYNGNISSVVEYRSFQPAEYDDESTEFIITVAIVAACGVVVVIGILLTIRCLKRRKHARWIQSISSEDVAKLHAEQVRQEKIYKALDESTKSMWTSELIPRIVRWFMPIVILGNIALFLSGHLSLGATVAVYVQIAGQNMALDRFFEFSMARSVGDIWSAGAEVLAVLLLLFSGVWPYTKQLITLVLWFAPPNRVSVNRRGNIFLWLDRLAKWSFADIIVLVLTMAAFRVSVQSPDDHASFLADLYAIDLMVIPVWGLYANMIAQLVSQVSSHFIIHYHQRIVVVGLREEERKEQNVSFDGEHSDFDQDGDGENVASRYRDVEQQQQIQCCGALRDHVYEIEAKTGGDRRVKVRRRASILAAAVGTLSATLLIAGCIVPSFRLETLGLVGVAVELGQGGTAAIRDYSVIDLARVLMDEARFLDVPAQYVGLGSLAAIMVLTSLVAPLFQIMILLYIWGAPAMTMRRRKRLVISVHILQAWQYVEVYLASLIVAVWQLGEVSGFIVNDVLGDALDGMFSSLVFYGLLKPDDAQTFYVQPSLQSGTYLLLGAAISMGIFSQFVMRADRQQRHDITERAKIQSQSIGTGRKVEADELQRAVVHDNNLDDDEEMQQLMSQVKPIPLRFTDCFRWLTEKVDGQTTTPLPPDLTLQPTFEEEDLGEDTHNDNDIVENDIVQVEAAVTA